MKAHLERDWSRGGYSLYLWHEGTDYRVPFVMEGGGRLLYDDNNAIQFGEVMPPTLFIGDEFYSAIRSAFVGDAIDNDDAAQDARKVRDRLLAMIESEWQSRQLEKH